MEDHSDSSVVDEHVTEGSGEKEQHDVISSSSSSSDSDSEKPASISPSPLKISRLFGRETSIHDVLGGGKPANLFLWRNKKVSAGTFSGVTAIWIFFDLLEYHVLTFTCYLLISTISVLFVWSSASAFINKSPPNIPAISLRDDMLAGLASAFISEANRVISKLHDVASGRNLKQFLFVVSGLWVLSIIGSWCNFLTVFYISFALLNVIPVVYEKYEDPIEAFLGKASIWVMKQWEVLDAKVLSKLPRGPLKKKKKF